MKRAKRTPAPLIGLLCLWIMGILACSLPTAVKNLVETVIPSSPTLNPSLTPTLIANTPTPSVTATNQPAITPIMPTESPPSPAPTSTRAAPSLTPTPKRSPVVLWDLSHGPRQSETGSYYEPKGVYSSLVSLLGENGISVVSNYDSLERTDLSSYAVLVVSMASAVEREFTIEEAQSVSEFIQNGGSLLVLAETPGFTNRIQPLLDLFYVQISSRSIPGPIQQFQSHPIYAGVNEIWLLFGGCSFNITSPPAEAIAFYEGEPVIIVVEQNSGRTLIIGDSNLFDNRGLPKNEQFAINVFRWLTFSP
jgi:hypothetical protein